MVVANIRGMIRNMGASMKPSMMTIMDSIGLPKSIYCVRVCRHALNKKLNIGV